MSSPFLSLFAAHLFADFLLQSASQIEGKTRGASGAFLRHGATHWAASVVMLLLFEPQVAGEAGSNRRRPGMPNAGMYIGWLERAIVLTAIAVGAETMVGLVIAAKAIIRFKETDTAFAEYFLLGTFLSLFLAGAGAFLLRALVRPLPFPP